jgi:putative FmdB family regulatory protein
MFYKFKCKSCGKTFEVEIPIKAYDAEKGKQTCPACNGKMERVIEWNGIASGSGAGWFGKSDGSNAI